MDSLSLLFNVCMEPAASMTLHNIAWKYNLQFRFHKEKIGSDPSLGFYTAFNWILQRIFALHKDTGGEGVIAALYRSMRNKRWIGGEFFWTAPPPIWKKEGKEEENWEKK